MTTTLTAPHPDGFNGARDASILANYDREGGVVQVQATKRTKGLLHRAGFQRTRTNAFYAVSVRRDSFNHLQLA